LAADRLRRVAVTVGDNPLSHWFDKKHQGLAQPRRAILLSGTTTNTVAVLLTVIYVMHNSREDMAQRP
jgi:hypothetical protein